MANPASFLALLEVVSKRNNGEELAETYVTLTVSLLLQWTSGPAKKERDIKDTELLRKRKAI